MIEFSLLLYAAAFLFSAFFPSSFAIEYASACIVHEWGHIFCGSLLKIYTSRPKLKFLRAVISLKTDDCLLTVLTALFGPIANILSSILCLLFSNKSLYPFSVISFFLAIINLMPVRSLDGYVILKSALSDVFSLKSATQIADILSDIILTVCIAISSYRMIKYGDSALAYLFFISCVFKCRRNQKSNTSINWNARIKEEGGV